MLRTDIGEPLGTEMVTLYIVRLNPLELVFNTRPITALLGYSVDEQGEMTMETVNRLMHPEDAPHLASHLERLQTLPDGQIAEFRHRLRNRSGDWSWIEVRDAVFTRDADGAPREVIGSAREVTAQMRTAEALQASEARHRLLVETMRQGVVHHAADGSIVALNPAAERILGRPRETFIGSDPDREEHNTIREDGTIFAGPDHPSSVALRTGQPVHGVVMGVYNWERREYRWISVDAVPLHRPGESLPYEAYTVFEDITERRRTDTALRDAHTRKDQFIATLAHELRSPLAPIRHAVAVQQRRSAAANDSELAWSQAIIDRQVGHMSRLLDDLLDASRIASGKLELRTDRIGLGVIIQQSIETARPQIDAARQTLTVTLPTPDILLEGDPIRLAQVFSNLLTNAAKYSDAGGTIAVTAERIDTDVVVTVRDTGIGIAPDHLASVFEMFGQVDAAIDRSQGGLGIGLSLAQALAELHGGRIRAESAGIGHGTSFIVSLPALPADVEIRPVVAAPAAPAVVAARRLLVVDDNRDGCDALATLLGMIGYDVVTAYDGAQAVERAAESAPDVILMDVGLPRLNGYEACAQIRATPRGADVVMLAVTGWGAEQDLRAAAQAGFDAHLVKPIDMKWLEQLLPHPREEVRRLETIRRMRQGLIP